VSTFIRLVFASPVLVSTNGWRPERPPPTRVVVVVDEVGVVVDVDVVVEPGSVVDVDVVVEPGSVVDVLVLVVEVVVVVVVVGDPERSALIATLSMSGWAVPTGLKVRRT
jgi:hypothetical protein